MPWSDTRLAGMCVYCNDGPGTRDHIPPKFFLDRPYPDHLAVVPSCGECNLAASLDEEYVGCLLEVVACGTTDAEQLSREKVAETFRRRPHLQARIEQSLCRTSTGDLIMRPEAEHRLMGVLAKLARGIWSYETSELAGDLQPHIRAVPVSMLTSVEVDEFFRLEPPDLLPEVGSRMMDRVLEGGVVSNEWICVQADRFEYAVEVRGGSAGRVKMVLSGWLVAEVDLDHHP